MVPPTPSVSMPPCQQLVYFLSLIFSLSHSIAQDDEDASNPLLPQPYYPTMAEPYSLFFLAYIAFCISDTSATRMLSDFVIFFILEYGR